MALEEQAKTEIAARAVMDQVDASKVKGTLPPAEREAAEKNANIAKKLRERLGLGTKPREIWEGLKAPSAKPDDAPMPLIEAKTVIDKNLPAGHPERVNADKVAELSREYVEKGYDEIHAADPARAKELVDSVAELLKDDPQWKDIFETQTDPTGARETFAKELLKRPEMARKVKELFDTRIAKDKLIKSQKEAAEKDKRKAQHNKKQEEDKKKYADRAATRKQQELNDYTKKTGIKYIARVDSLKNAHTYQSNIDTAQDEITKLNATELVAANGLLAKAANQLEKDKARGEIGIVNAKIAAEESKITTNRGKLALAGKIDAEQDQIQKDLARLQTESFEADEAIRQRATEESIADTDVVIGNIRDTEARDKFATEVKSIMKDAAKKVLEEEITHTRDEFVKILEADEKATTDKATAVLSRDLQTRWRTNKNHRIRRWKKDDAPDEDQIKNDFKLITRPEVVTEATKGPREILAEILQNAEEPGYPDAEHPVSRTGKAGMRAVFNDREIDEKMTDDKFVREQELKIAEGIVLAYAETGKKLEGDEKAVINSTRWKDDLLTKAEAKLKEMGEAEAAKKGEKFLGINKNALKKLKYPAIIALILGGGIGGMAIARALGIL